MPVNHEITTENYYRYRYSAERSHYEFLAKAAKCEAFFAGNQWAASDLAALSLQRRPALTINKIKSTIQTVQGEQILNRNEVVFRPAAGASAETADALTKVWMQIAQNNQLPWVRSQVFDDGIIRSRGFYDVRLDFTDSMQGEVRITALNSKNVVIDPDAEEYDPDGWADVFITKWLTYQDIAILYDEQDAELLRARDGDAARVAIGVVEDDLLGDGTDGGGEHGPARSLRFATAVDGHHDAVEVELAVEVRGDDANVDAERPGESVSHLPRRPLGLALVEFRHLLPGEEATAGPFDVPLAEPEALPKQLHPARRIDRLFLLDHAGNMTCHAS